MERTTCTLIYYLRKTRIDKEGKAPIYVRLTVNGQRAEVCARARILDGKELTAAGIMDYRTWATPAVRSHLIIAKRISQRPKETVRRKIKKLHVRNMQSCVRQRHKID